MRTRRKQKNSISILVLSFGTHPLFLKKKKKGLPLPPIVHAVLDPASDARSARGRIIIVGDVHGCTAELRELLDKLQYRPPPGKTSSGGGDGGGGGDLLVFVGDLVNKGPDPIGTLELAMASGGICVRGNHDEAAVALRRRMDKEGKSAAEATAAKAAAGAAKKEKDKKKKDKKKDKAAALLLPISELLVHMPWVADPRAERGLRWLADAPFSLRLGSRGVTVVHAGLVPNSSSSSASASPPPPAAAAAATLVESQRLEDLLEVRHVARDFPAAAVDGGGGGAGAAAAPASPSSVASPSPPSSSGGWRAIDKKLAKQAEKEGAHASGLSVSLWAREYRAGEGGDGAGGGGGGGGGGKLSTSPSPSSSLLPPPPPPPRSAGHVVFGHHASLGLQQEASATGIDTGCVLGGELTALVLGPLPESGVGGVGGVGGAGGVGGSDEGAKKKKKAASASSSSAGWKTLPGGAMLVSVKARRAYVGKEAADAGAEEC